MKHFFIIYKSKIERSKKKKSTTKIFLNHENRTEDCCLKLKLLVLVLRPALAPTFTEEITGLSVEIVAFPMETSPDEFD
jgi:hypothetical protein